jgi:hypothetical protein
MILIYSNPTINRVMDNVPEFFDRTFNNVEKHFKGIEQNCTGQKCRDCLLCYTKGNGATQIVEAVK